MSFSRILITYTLLSLLVACSTKAVEKNPTPIISPTQVDEQILQVEETEEAFVPLPTIEEIKSLGEKNSKETSTPGSTAFQITSIPPTKIKTNPKPTLKPDDWQELPVIPVVSDKVLEIYKTGLELGNNPRAFSKVGDCGSTPAWFLGDFDRGTEFYSLGEHQVLETVIEVFQGSFERTSLAARSGFNASALFSPLWSDWTYCKADESPLTCEYRIHKPIIAFIMLGTNDIWKPEEFEPQMRKILEYSIEKGVIPIISTKADNQEGDHSINKTIANLAWEYEIPLLNYWLAVQPLPDKGLQEDEAHLTFGRNFFDDPQAMQKAWPIRNLTALQALDAVWSKIDSAKP